MLLVSLVLLGGLGSRLAYLQLLQGERNRTLAQSNRIRVLPQPPVRGNLYDRNGKVLAGNQLSRAAYVWPLVQRNPDWPQIRERLARILDPSQAEIQQRIERADPRSPKLIRIARDLSPAQMTALAEHRPQLEGVEVEVEQVRRYPHGKAAAHVLGYTAPITRGELIRRRDEGYRMDDVIGRMGIEAAFDRQLRGEWGGQRVAVNAAGNIERVLGEQPAQAGQDITLTLDLGLQKAAEKALGTRKGAVVALDPSNGAVRAMVSHPSFDPNVFSGTVDSATWQRLQSKDNPFINRAVRGFPPASTFKLVTATAGLESPQFSPNTVLNTHPYITVHGLKFREWNGAGFGPLGFAGALQNSSNTFFGQVGKRLGGEPLLRWAKTYGYGSPTGIALPSESSGLLPTHEWRQDNMDRPWGTGDAVNLALGQGFTLATPLQVAAAFAVPANGGDRVQPHLRQGADTIRRSIHIQPQHLQLIRRGLRQVVQAGTGKALNVSELPAAAGKSGTAEVRGLAHAWFAGFAPFKDPEIVVVAFAEHSGGGGGSVAGPIVRKVMKAHFGVSDEKSGKNGQEGNSG